MPRGRPRLTPSDYEDRLRAYCARHDVSATAAGIPPFPTGQRETDQHREWMALYRAHSRLNARRASPSTPAHGACPLCGRIVAADEALPHRSAVLHPACHGIVTAVETLGAAGFERLRAHLWPERPAPSNRPGRRRTAG